MGDLWSLWFFLISLGLGAAVLLGIIWYDPMRRLENDLALGVLHVDRVVQDALTQLRSEPQRSTHSSFVYVNPIAGQTGRLRTLSASNLSLLDQNAEMVRGQLLMQIDAWNQHAGQMATSETALMVLSEMSKPANYLRGLISDDTLLEAHAEIYHECLFQAVGPVGEHRKTIH